jgi:site-specific DNA recombinase
VTEGRLRAGVHARRSINREDGVSASVQRQMRAGRELADRLGAEVVKVYDEDDTSAFKKRVVVLPDGRSVRRNVRPTWQQILTDLYEGEIELLIEYDLDRSMREPRDLEDLIEIVEGKGRRVESVTGSLRLRNDAEITMARIGVAVANKSSRDTARRVRAAAADRAVNGRHHGGVRAFGYTADGKGLVPAEADALRDAYGKVLAGVSLGEITRDLQRRGVPTVKGAPWSTRAVRDALLRPRNYGARVYRDERCRVGPHDHAIVGMGSPALAIIDEDTWRAVHAILTDEGRKMATGNSAAYLLSGIARCGGCGETVVSGGVRAEKSGARRRVYRCRHGGHVTIRGDWVDQFVSEVVIERLGRPDAADLFADDERPDAAELRDQARALRVRIDETRAAFEDLRVPVAQTKATMERLTARLAEVEAALAQTSRAPVLADLVSAEDVRAVWGRLPLARQRAVVDVLMTLTLRPGGVGRKYFDPERVEVMWKAS